MCICHHWHPLQVNYSSLLPPSGRLFSSVQNRVTLLWTSVSENVTCLQTRPTPPHLTSAMAENILAAACENESRNAAKRMRLEAYHVRALFASPAFCF